MGVPTRPPPTLEDARGGSASYRCFICGRTQVHRTQTGSDRITLRTWRHNLFPNIFMCRLTLPYILPTRKGTAACYDFWLRTEQNLWPFSHWTRNLLAVFCWKPPLTFGNFFDIVKFLFSIPEHHGESIIEFGPGTLSDTEEQENDLAVDARERSFYLATNGWHDARLLVAPPDNRFNVSPFSLAIHYLPNSLQ